MRKLLISGLLLFFYMLGNSQDNVMLSESKILVLEEEDIRWQEGKKLLESPTDLTIAEICYQVGYKHPSHFSRDFKDYIGVNPNIYKFNN